MGSTLALPLTVAAGLIAMTDLQSRELQEPFGVLFAAAFFLAAWHPDGAWRRGLMLGLSLPVAHLVADVTGRTLPYTMDPPALTLLAVMPAMLGTLVGMMVARLRHPHDASNETLEPPR